MAVKTREELMESLNQIVGETPDDTTLEFMQDVGDTLAQITEQRDNEEWKQKYDNLDAEWRKKYRDRFFAGNDNNVPLNGASESEDDDEKRANSIQIKDLFTN